MSKDLIRRNRALTATLGKFRGKPMELGKYDCVKAARFHLVKMGHKSLPATGTYSTPGGAIRALRRQGAKTLEQLLDKHLQRIPPAAMRAGDIGLVDAAPGEEAIGGGTVVISVGRKFIGWHENGEGFDVLESTVPMPFKAAWRA